jgi:hypothetical protein
VATDGVGDHEAVHCGHRERPEGIVRRESSGRNCSM